MKHPLQLVTFLLPGLIPSAPFHLRLLQAGSRMSLGCQFIPCDPHHRQPPQLQSLGGMGITRSHSSGQHGIQPAHNTKQRSLPIFFLF